MARTHVLSVSVPLPGIRHVERIRNRNRNRTETEPEPRWSILGEPEFFFLFVVLLSFTNGACLKSWHANAVETLQ